MHMRFSGAYIFISIHFNSILFYSIQRDEKNETQRKIENKRKKRKWNEKNETKGNVKYC